MKIYFPSKITLGSFELQCNRSEKQDKANFSFEKGALYFRSQSLFSKIKDIGNRGDSGLFKNEDDMVFNVVFDIESSYKDGYGYAYPIMTITPEEDDYEIEYALEINEKEEKYIISQFKIIYSDLKDALGIADFDILDNIFQIPKNFDADHFEMCSHLKAERCHYNDSDWSLSGNTLGLSILPLLNAIDKPDFMVVQTYGFPIVYFVRVITEGVTDKNIFIYKEK